MPVIRPLPSNVIPLAVAPVSVLVMLRAPVPLTVKPESAAALTAPMVVVVATGMSLAVSAAVPVTWPWASNVIPLDVPGVTALVWPMSPVVLSRPRSRDSDGIFAAVTVLLLSFPPSIPLLSLASITAPSIMEFVLTEMSASSLAPTAFAAI